MGTGVAVGGARVATGGTTVGAGAAGELHATNRLVKTITQYTTRD
jgi:hypothetical protein